MKFLLYCNCVHCFPPKPVGCVFDHPVVMCCLIWAVVILVLGILLLHYLKKKSEMKCKEANNMREHEIRLREMTFEQEKYWHKEKSQVNSCKNK